MVHFKIIYFFNSYDEYNKLNQNDRWGWKKKVDFLKELKRYDEAL